MKVSAKTTFCTALVAAALVSSGSAFAQSNVSTDSSTTTDTTTAAGMKGQDSVRPSDSTMGQTASETRVQKHQSVEQYGTKAVDGDGVKSGTTRSTDEMRSSTSTTDDSQ